VAAEDGLTAATSLIPAGFVLGKPLKGSLTWLEKGKGGANLVRYAAAQDKVVEGELMVVAESCITILAPRRGSRGDLAREQRFQHQKQISPVVTKRSPNMVTWGLR
jgi:hypothetical protein